MNIGTTLGNFHLRTRTEYFSLAREAFYGPTQRDVSDFDAPSYLVSDNKLFYLERLTPSGKPVVWRVNRDYERGAKLKSSELKGLLFRPFTDEMKLFTKSWDDLIVDAVGEGLNVPVESVQEVADKLQKRLVECARTIYSHYGSSFIGYGNRFKELTLPAKRYYSGDPIADLEFIDQTPEIQDFYRSKVTDWSRNVTVELRNEIQDIRRKLAVLST